MHGSHQFDIVLFGAGIAGLWLYNVLEKKGFNCLLLETGSIGGEQTIHSQGIIHGGLKYALSGTLGTEADAIAGMPDAWRQCINGNGKETPHHLDLSNTCVLSDTQFMWSTGGMASRFTTFFASKLLRGRIERVTPDSFPDALAHKEFKGKVFRLNDLVIDTDSLLQDLAGQMEKPVLQIPKQGISFKRDGDGVSIFINGQEIYCQRAMFTAGEGNRSLIELAGIHQQCQDRPLQMVMCRHSLPLFYGHCIGTGSRPRLTITSHPAGQDVIWYLGGELAEEGTGMDPASLVNRAQQELKALFPWLDFTGARWDTWKGTRAEPRQQQLVKPDSAWITSEGPFFVCWPTKLTLAPDLAEKTLSLLAGLEPSRQGSETEPSLPDFPQAPITPPFWENCFA